MATADATARRFDMGRVIKRTFSVVGNNLAAFALLSFLPAAPLAVLNWGQVRLEQSPELEFDTIALIALAGFAYLVSAFVLQAAVVHGSVADLNGKRATFGDSLSTGLSHFVPSLLIALLYMLGVLGGMILLVVPGIILAIAWSLAIPVRVVERTGPSAALGRSYELTRGHRWVIFALYVVFGLIGFILAIVIGATTGFAAAAAAAASNGWPEIAASTIAAMIGAILNSAMFAAVYYELRQIKEGIGPEALASVFD